MTGAELIMLERQRQINEKGFNAFGDDTYKDDQLLKAAYTYMCSGNGAALTELDVEVTWPWPPSTFRPSGDPVRDLTKAGALIAAEIDRLIRAQETETT